MKNQSLLFKVMRYYGVEFPNHPGKARLHKYLREKFNLNDIDQEFIVSRGGLRWALNPADGMQRSFFWLGFLDYWDVYHVTRILKTDSVIFDVGANFGYYSIVLATHLNRRCRAYSFEPHPETYSRLAKNIILNELTEVVTPCNIGFSDVSGTASMVESDEHSGVARVSHELASGPDIRLSTIDEFCAENKIEKIDFMKIDVEGYEEKALLGGSEIIRKTRPLILLELCPENLRRIGSKPEFVFDLLHDLGYEDFLVASRQKMAPLTSFHDFKYVNVFCCPNVKCF